MAVMFSKQSRFDAAHDHIERAKSHVADDAYRLGRAIELQARFWSKQGMLDKAKLEASRAIDVYTKVGATRDIEDCRVLLRMIGELDLSDPGASLQTVPLTACINVPPEVRKLNETIVLIPPPTKPFVTVIIPTSSFFFLMVIFTLSISPIPTCSTHHPRYLYVTIAQTCTSRTPGPVYSIRGLLRLSVSDRMQL